LYLRVGGAIQRDWGEIKLLDVGAALPARPLVMLKDLQSCKSFFI
jgi:hypothetical protein